MDYMHMIGMILPSAFSLAGGYYMYKLQRRDRIIEEEKESRKREIAEEKVAQKQESVPQSRRERPCDESIQRSS